MGLVEVDEQRNSWNVLRIKHFNGLYFLFCAGIILSFFTFAAEKLNKIIGEYRELKAFNQSYSKQYMCARDSLLCKGNVSYKSAFRIKINNTSRRHKNVYLNFL